MQSTFLWNNTVTVWMKKHLAWGVTVSYEKPDGYPRQVLIEWQERVAAVSVNYVFLHDKLIEFDGLTQSSCSWLCRPGIWAVLTRDSFSLFHMALAAEIHWGLATSRSWCLDAGRQWDTSTLLMWPLSSRAALSNMVTTIHLWLFT